MQKCEHGESNQQIKGKEHINTQPLQLRQKRFEQHDLYLVHHLLSLNGPLTLESIRNYFDGHVATIRIPIGRDDLEQCRIEGCAHTGLRTLAGHKAAVGSPQTVVISSSAVFTYMPEDKRMYVVTMIQIPPHFPYRRVLPPWKSPGETQMLSTGCRHLHSTDRFAIACPSRLLRKLMWRLLKR